MIPFVDLKRQYSQIKGEIDEGVKEVLESGKYILGKNVDSFEAEFSGYLGKRYSVGVGNGTEALQMALMASGVGKGDEVITVANTAVPTIIAILSVGAKPVFADIDDHFNIDFSKIHVTKKTKAIIPVHLFGQSCDIKPIIEMCSSKDLVLIEDCCQAHGAEYKGRKVPVSSIGCFSFYPTKNLGCYGDGGLIALDDEELAEKIKLIRNCGHSNDYLHPVKGINSRLDEVQAAILRVKLKYLDEWNERRRKIAKLYDRNLAKVITPKESSFAKHVYHLYAVRSKKRDGLREFLKKNDIFTQVHYPMPVYSQEGYKELEHDKLANTESIMKEILSLPMFPELTKEEVDKVIGKVNEYEG